MRKRFGATVALDRIDLAAERGRVLGLLGPNGSGKTTCVRILSTLLRPDSGRARVAGFDEVDDAAPLRAVIGLAGQYAAVDELLTGRENLDLVGLWYHLPRRERRRRADEILERFGLTSAANRTVGTYSGGMRRRLDVGASLIARPPVLFLDEPTTGLDPRTRNDLWQLIEELVADGTTVLLTTQYMDEAERLAHRIVVLDLGRVIATGTADELKDRMGGNVLAEIPLDDLGDLWPATDDTTDLRAGGRDSERGTDRPLRRADRRRCLALPVVVVLIEIVEETRAERLPSEQSPRDVGRGGAIKADEMAHETEVLDRDIRVDRGRRQAEVATHRLSDLHEGDPFVSDCVQHRPSRSGLDGEAGQAGSVASVHRRPTVGTVPDVSRHAVLAGDVDEGRNETLVTVAVDGRGEAQDRRAHADAPQRQREQGGRRPEPSWIGANVGAWNESVVFRRGPAERHPDHAGREHERPVRAGQGRSHRLDGTPVGTRGCAEVASLEGHVVLEGQVDHAVRVGRSLGKTVGVVEVPLLDDGTGRLQASCRGLGAGEANHLVAGAEQLGHHRRTDPARRASDEDSHGKASFK